MKKNIIRIQVPNSCIRGKVKQANGNDYSYRIVLPKDAGKYRSHVLLISERFTNKEEKNIMLNFYEGSRVQLSNPHHTPIGMIYEKVETTANELADIMKKDVVQKKENKKLYTNEEIAYLNKNVNALDFIEEHTGFTFEKQGKYFRCQQHNSFVIDAYKNVIYWNSMGVKGTVLDFLMKAEDKSFTDAIEVMKKYHEGLSQEQKEFKPKEYRQIEFKLPETKKTQYNVKRYLCHERAIREDIVDHFMNKGQIYEDEKGNVVFVSKDYKDEEVGAFVRSTYSNFKGDVGGSNKFTGFYINSCPGAKKLVITEAYIDALSYLSYKMNIGDDIDFNVLGCASCTVMDETFRQNYLLRKELNQNIDTVILAADNDHAGVKAMDEFKEFVKPFKYIKHVIVDAPELVKDWNQELCEYQNEENEQKIEQEFVD